MKILILANNSSGLFKFRGELLETLIAQHHDVFFAVPKGDFIEEMQHMGCHFIETEISRHGTNPFINKYLAKKMKQNPDKIPWTINKYGNTASVSVPLTIISELKDKLTEPKKLMLNAFGVGMSWSTAIVPFVDCRISEIVEV